MLIHEDSRNTFLTWWFAEKPHTSFILLHQPYQSSKGDFAIGHEVMKFTYEPIPYRTDLEKTYFRVTSTSSRPTYTSERDGQQYPATLRRGAASLSDYAYGVVADIDIGKPGGYPPDRAAVDKILATEGFPPPHYLGQSSPGGLGLHAMWATNQVSVTRAVPHMKAISGALGRIWADHGYKIDTAVTCDPARILTLPGSTVNGEKVNGLLDPFPKYDLRQLKSQFESLSPPPTPPIGHRQRVAVSGDGSVAARFAQGITEGHIDRLLGFIRCERVSPGSTRFRYEYSESDDAGELTDSGWIVIYSQSLINDLPSIDPDLDPIVSASHVAMSLHHVDFVMGGAA